MEAKDKLVETLCIDCCDGYGGRCQRYPELSRTCNDFYPMEKAYKAGIREVVEWVNEHTYGGLGHTHADDWQAQLKIWFKDNPKLLKEWGIE